MKENKIENTSLWIITKKLIFQSTGEIKNIKSIEAYKKITLFLESCCINKKVLSFLNAEIATKDPTPKFPKVLKVLKFKFKGLFK